MQTVLKTYQERAVDSLFEQAERLQSQSDSIPNLNVLLRGDCGTGKTLTLAGFIEKFSGAKHLSTCRSRKTNGTVFLFLTPGTMNLTTQSYSCLAYELQNFGITVHHIKDAGVVSLTPHNGMVIVANYECLTSRNKRGEHINKLTRNGETANLYNFLKSVDNGGFELVIIVDEAHHGNHTQNGRIGEFVRQVTGTMAPKKVVRVEATATPAKASPEDVVQIRKCDAVEEGVIRPKHIINYGRAGGTEGARLRAELRAINPEFDCVDGELAYLMHKQYLVVNEEVQEGELSYNPLMIIVVSNTAQGDKEMDFFKRFFAAMKEPITEENGGIAKLMADDGMSYDEQVAISDITSPVKVVFTKTKASTGWNCPRAQFLLFARSLGENSSVFVGQMKGRLGRNVHGKKRPEGQEESKYGYIFIEGNEQLMQQEYADDTCYVATAVADEKQLALINSSGIRRSVQKRTERGGLDAEGNDVTQAFYAGVFRSGAVTQERLRPGKKKLSHQVTGQQDLEEGVRLKRNLNVDSAYTHHLKWQAIYLLQEYLVEAGMDVVGKYAETAIEPFKDFLREVRPTASDAALYSLVLLDHENRPKTGGAAKMMRQIAGKALERFKSTTHSKYAPAYHPYEAPRVRNYVGNAKTRDLPEAVGACHLYGPNIMHPTDSLIETDFEDMVIAPLAAKGMIASWFYNAKTDSYGKAFSMAYPVNGTMELPHSVHTNPDYILFLWDKQGNVLPLSVDTKGYCSVKGSATDCGPDAKIRDKVRAAMQQTASNAKYGKRGMGTEKGTHIAAVVYPRPVGKRVVWMVQLEDDKSVPLFTWLRSFVNFPA